MPAPEPIPALLQNRSTGPMCFSAVATSARTSLSRVTSLATPTV